MSTCAPIRYNTSMLIAREEEKVIETPCNGECGCPGCEDCASVLNEIGFPLSCGECGHLVTELPR